MLERHARGRLFCFCFHPSSGVFARQATGQMICPGSGSKHTSASSSCSDQQLPLNTYSLGQFGSWMCSMRHLTKNSLPHRELLSPSPRASSSRIRWCATRATSLPFSKHTCSLQNKTKISARGQRWVREGEDLPWVLRLSPGGSSSLGILSLPRLQNAPILLLPHSPEHIQSSLYFAVAYPSLLQSPVLVNSSLYSSSMCRSPGGFSLLSLDLGYHNWGEAKKFWTWHNNSIYVPLFICQALFQVLCVYELI